MHKSELSEIADFPLFADIASADLADLIATSRTVRVHKNNTVFAQGGDAQSFFVLVDGYIRAIKTTEDGEEITVRYVSPGELFGVAVAIGLDRYPATAVAVVDATILSWPSTQWPILAVKYPALSSNALRAVGGRLQDAHARVIELTSEEVERRIARTLLRLADQAGRNVETGVEIAIPLRRQDIGQLTGTTLHSVSRVLSAWEQNGLVSTDHQRIILRKSDTLAAIASGNSPGLQRTRNGA
jgi:CRP/FNR family transcriptional regulator, nitrogen oxide reductase regulator